MANLLDRLREILQHNISSRSECGEIGMQQGSDGGHHNIRDEVPVEQKRFVKREHRPSEPTDDEWRTHGGI